MLSSLLFGLAFAETTVAWQPALQGTGELAPDGFVASDFDGDGIVDFLGSLQLANGNIAFVADLSTGNGPVEHELDFEVGDTVWDVVDIDGDGIDELYVGLPYFDNGEMFLLRGTNLVDPIDEWQFLFSTDGYTGDRFGIDVDFGDIDGDAVKEIIASSPVADSVVVFQYELSAEPEWSTEAKAIVRSDEASLGNPFAVVEDRDGDGFVDIAAATLKGTLMIPSSLTVGELNIAHPFEVGSFSGAPRALVRMPDFDASGADDVIWLTDDAMVWFNPDNANATTWPVSPTGGLLATDDGVWIGDGGQTKYYPLDGGSIQTFAVGGTNLGSALFASKTDLDADGCIEVYASAPELNTVYLLDAECGLVDTGEDTGDTDDTGETGDPTDDTGDPTDDTDGPPDTGLPVDTDDDTGVFCVPEFGWTCSAVDARGGLFGGLLVAAGLLLMRLQR